MPTPLTLERTVSITLLGFSVDDMLLFSAAALRWGKGLPPLIHSSMAFVGNHSYTIYLSHPLFCWRVNGWHTIAWQEPWSLFFGLFLFTLAGSLVLAEVMKQIALRFPAWTSTPA
jgi:peptidoglycan/LPS O-acetylase OafA/YrhL